MTAYPLEFQSLRLYPPVTTVQDSYEIVIWAGVAGYGNVEVGTLRTFLTAEIIERLDAMDHEAPLASLVTDTYSLIPEGLAYSQSDSEFPGVQYAAVFNINAGPNRVAQIVLGAQSDEFLWRGFRVLDGGWGPTRRVWHDGNFDPDTKLGVNDPVYAADKLNTARTINGIPFDGTQDIVISVDGSAGGDKTYTHSQTLPSTEWLVNHGLGKFPAVTVLDSAGSTMGCAIEHIDLNNVRIAAAYPIAGKAIFN